MKSINKNKEDQIIIIIIFKDIRSFQCVSLSNYFRLSEWRELKNLFTT